MRSIFFILAFIFIGFSAAEAQELKKPLAPQAQTDTIPPSPGEAFTWIPAHWSWERVEYVWVEGTYVEKKEGHDWVAGSWTRSKNTGLWSYSKGYWTRSTGNTMFNSKSKNGDLSPISTGGIEFSTK